MKIAGPKIYSFDTGPMGAIGEQGSLLIRINRNCPWNRCLFCDVYKRRKFEYRSKEEVKRDITVIDSLCDEITTASLDLGYSGEIPSDIINAIILENPEIYGRTVDPQTRNSRLSSLFNVVHWLNHGEKTVFLQDANALIMRTHELSDVITYLKDKFPSIERITSYARSKTCVQKSLAELKELSHAGLSRVLVGLESGYDPVLEYMQKGVTADEHVKAGTKIVESGMYLVEFVMPGLGGKKYSEKHILETARVLNEIEPNLIRIRSLAIQENSPLHERWKSGEFEQPTDDQMVNEIRLLIENLNFDCKIETGQLTNILFELDGSLPQDKKTMLTIIEQYKSKPLIERLRFRLERYLTYYLPFVEAQGKLDHQLQQQIKEAVERLKHESSDAEEKVDQATSTIKGKCIP